MTPTPTWIAVTAVSALSVGVIASGAIGVASAMPLVDVTTAADVPPISTVPSDGASNDPIDGVITPVPTPSSSSAPASSPSAEPVAPSSPQPVAPRPAATADDSAPSAPESDDDSSGSSRGSSGSGSDDETDD